MTDTPDTSDREIVTTRVIDAPRELVFKVWTEPEHLAQWWGPDGFTTDIQEMDVRPGGAWKYFMNGPDGVRFRHENVFLEVVPPERIVYDHITGPTFVATATFEELEDGRTRLTLRMVLDSAEKRDRVEREFGAIEGARQMMARLAEYLTKLSLTKGGGR
ncbi:MAG TPA: SRPBCC family protein [Candidatus Eisenbacteria bacterium]|nr:SRPBCC family protein [Candidatus Eisenbacteria bacterium]